MLCLVLRPGRLQPWVNWCRLAAPILCYVRPSNSVVGTTLKLADKLPQDILADEKHTYLNGHKCYIATTVAGDCIFGASVSLTAEAKGLTEAYSHFKTEAQNLSPSYAPKTVNIDGWTATHHSWLSLFKTVTPLLCFLHAFIKIRSRCKNQPFFPDLSRQVWHIYHAPDKATFKTRVQTLRQWAQATLPAGPALEAVLKLCHRQDDFLRAYDYPSAYRTSTMLDRQMDLMHRYLFSTKYFHLALARDQALAASRLKTQLLVNVSHDTRTPLNAILGYAEMLPDGSDPSG